LSGVSPASGQKSGRSDRKRDSDLAESDTSTAAGQKNGQINRKRNFGLTLKVSGFGFQVSDQYVINNCSNFSITSGNDDLFLPFVIPAKAGIQADFEPLLDSGFRRNDAINPDFLRTYQLYSFPHGSLETRSKVDPTTVIELGAKFQEATGCAET